ncbi:MAG: DUF262 domain-containing protein [Veillonella sp.]|nr:DUF262 domain-containing protein [Veillonella sp.]
MNKTIYTFWELIKETQIVIPQVQRDYAYGRDDKKARSVSDNILHSIHEVLLPNKTENNDVPVLTMDFVYGSVVDNVGLLPLDGQQRLTTLFLLYLYASIVEEKEAERKVLKNFCYETRQSANNFCKSLIDDFKYDKNFNKKSLSSQILNNPKCLPNYKDDPTISSMLVILDKITSTFADISGIWDKLTTQRRIIFYFLPLNKFGLSDDLYIKMNSRGKSLTNYELYKSDFLEFLGQHYPNYKNVFSDSLDGKWTDILWKNAEVDAKKNKNVRSVDDGFMNIFSNASILFYHLRTDDNFSDNGNKPSKHLSLPFKEQFTSEDEIDKLFKIFDTIQCALSGEDVNKFWNKIFYLDNKILSEESNRIRLFWPQKENIFALTFRGELTRAQMIFFYSIFLGIQNSIDLDLLTKRLRHLRNLVVNSTFQLRGANIHGMLLETEKYILTGAFPSNEYFNSLQVDEEIQKEELTNWETLWKFENHNILRGSLDLFMRTKSLDLLDKFCSLFDENYTKNDTILRQAFLIAGEGQKDYCQYQAYMDNPNFTQRWFVCRPELWHNFFTWNQNRHNQEAIIECLRNLPKTTNELVPYINNGLSQLSKKSWKYYMVRYPGNWNTVKGDSQGIYHWDDIQKRPLEVIMLNSSYHGSSYLEWNILNLTLKCAFTEEHCRLDTHGHAAIQLMMANSFLDANQEGWILSSFEDDYIFHDLAAIKRDDGNFKYRMSEPFIKTENGPISRTIYVEDCIDYNEFGIDLINDIETVYSNHYKSTNQTDNAEAIDR